MIKSLVDQLDSGIGSRGQAIAAGVRLEKPVDATVVPTLAAMVPGAQVTLSADGRQLIVVARVVDQTVVKKMVEQWKEVDQPAGRAGAEDLSAGEGADRHRPDDDQDPGARCQSRRFRPTAVS